MELDSVQIGVADLDEATAAYTLLLGVEPVRLAGEVRRFQLGRGAVELESGEPGVHSIRFVGERPAGWPDAFHGLAVQLGARPALAAAAEAPAIDHVVVRTPDADRAICLWRDRLGLRLARDRLFPERALGDGGRADAAAPGAAVGWTSRARSASWDRRRVRAAGRA